MYDRPHSNSNPNRGDLDDGHDDDLPLPSRGGRRSRGGGAIAGDNEIRDRHGYGATYGGSGGGGGPGPPGRIHHAMNPDAVNNENYDKNTTTNFDAPGGTNNGYGNSRGGGYAGHPHAYHPYQRSSMTGGMIHPHRGSLDLSVGGMSAMGGMNMNMNVNMNMGGGGPMAGPGAGGGGPMGMGTNTTMAAGAGAWGPNGGAGGGGPSNASYGYAGMGHPAHGGPRPMNHRGSMGSLSGWGPMGGGGYPPSPGLDANAPPGNRENVDGNAGRAGREEGNDVARRGGSPRYVSEGRGGGGGGGNFDNKYPAYGGPTPRGMHGPDPRMAHQRNGGGPSARGPPTDEYPDEPEGIDYLAARAHAAQMLAAEESKRLEENLMRLEMRKMMMDRYPVGSARANAANDGSTSPPAPRDISGAKEGRRTPNGVMRPPLHETKGGASSSSYGYAGSAHHNAGDDFLMARAQTHLEGQRSAVGKSSAPSPAAGVGRYGNRSTAAGKHRDMDDGPDAPQDERNSRRGYNPNDRNDKTPPDDIHYNRKGGRNNGNSNNADYFSQGHNHMSNNNYPPPPHHPHQFHPSSNYPQFHRMSMSMMNAPGNMMMMNPNHPYPPMDAMHPYHPNAYPRPPMDDEHLAMRHGHLLGTAGFGNHPPAAPPHRHPQSRRGRDAPSKSDDKSQVAADGAAVEAPPPEVIVKPVKELSAPRRPLSAYNIFFSEMREIILKEHEGDDGNTDADKNGDGEDHDKGNDNDKGDGDDAHKDSASASSSPDKKPDSVVKKEGQEDGDEGDADMKDSSPDATKSSNKDDTNNDKTIQDNTTHGDNETNNDNDNDNDNKTPNSQKEKTDNDSSTPTLTPESNMEAFTQKLMKKRLDKSAGKRLHRRTHGKVAFTTLAQTVGKRWRELPEEKKKKYRELAEMDRARYRNEKQARGKALREEAKRQRKEAAARAAAAAAASR